ncbi:hypothetical protein [Larsenimonas rhizosphaerae]|uniref:Uncharacterized protein n=1 Tax=Larsenimonas rhizosphaerae TaxID=2944682 RepID=A0AA41ZHE6_9GAMM|nr:hypothetical protein [Larsenimonas rhizosphaerae]MCX2524731.1 hypothetical protein [Larsenimonas rhizosphaerae]
MTNAHGRSSRDTVFDYHVVEGRITGTYQGGPIQTGHLVGRVTGVDTFELLYHCVTTEGELLSGWSRGVAGVDLAWRTTLTFDWGWLPGASGGGISRYVELTDEEAPNPQEKRGLQGCAGAPIRIRT